MSSNRVTIRPDQFSKELYKAIAKYGDEVLEKTDKVAKDIAREATSEAKSKSPIGKEGKYARGWSHRRIKDGAWGVRQAVYNRTEYQLIHLLEYPHDTGGGGHYPKHKDHTGILAGIEDEYTKKFMEEVLEKL